MPLLNASRPAVAAGLERLTPRQVEKLSRDSVPGGSDAKPRLVVSRFPPAACGKTLAMPRAIWSGAISFGLVSVPVRLFTGDRVEGAEVPLPRPPGHEPDRLRQGEQGRPASTSTRTTSIRGFEVEKGRFVELTDEDIDRLDIELTHSIDICDFVSIDEIDPLYFRKAYYLLPQDGAEKPYRLLVRALERDRPRGDREGRHPQQAAPRVRPRRSAKTLVLETMYYADEVRRPEEAPAPQVRPAEVEMAKTLIENLAATWDPRALPRPVPQPAARPAARRRRRASRCPSRRRTRAARSST